MSRPRDLPEFHKPPVTEVALSAQFDDLRAFRITDFGVLWESAFRDDYPVVTAQPPLGPEFETFGDGPRVRGSLPFIQFGAGQPLARAWFANLAGTSLIQIQSDRFIHNWRKVGDNETYPRYENIRAMFIAELSQVSEYAKRTLSSSLNYNQCEVTYVNTIEAKELLSPTGTVFTLWSDLVASSFLPKQEGFRWHTRYVIRPSPDEAPVGRLLVEAASGLNQSGESIVQLTLTARGRPSSPTIEAVAEFLDLGREWVVRAFAEITSEEMHMRWMRIRAT